MKSLRTRVQKLIEYGRRKVAELKSARPDAEEPESLPKPTSVAEVWKNAHSEFLAGTEHLAQSLHPLPEAQMQVGLSSLPQIFRHHSARLEGRQASLIQEIDQLRVELGPDMRDPVPPKPDAPPVYPAVADIRAKRRV